MRSPQTTLREQLDVILAGSYKPDDPIRPKVKTLVEEAYADADDQTWEEVATRFKQAFGEGDVAVPQTRTRDDFESLVRTGTVSEYIEWTNEHESPTQYHFGSFITTVSGGLGRGPLLDWEARAVYPNLFTLLVGPAGARKGSAMDRALRLVVPAMGTNKLPNEGTHQGFAAALRRRMARNGGVADGLIVSDEFSVLISKDRNKEDLVKWLTDWYDSPAHWERALRGEEFYELENVYLSVLGGSNLAWLRTLPADAISGGFMPRFILFDAPDKRHWKARPRFNEKLERELFKKLEKVADTIPEKIGFDQTSGAYLDRWYEHDVQGEHYRCNDESFQRWLARKQAAAMKLATVWQLVDDGPKDYIAIEWLEKARRVVDWGDTAVERVYGALGVSQEGQVQEDVLEVVRESGGKINRTTLVGRLKKKYNAARIQGALNTLRQSGDLQPERVAGAGVVWSLMR